MSLRSSRCSSASKIQDDGKRFANDTLGVWLLKVAYAAALSLALVRNNLNTNANQTIKINYESIYRIGHFVKFFKMKWLKSTNIYLR